MNGTTDLSKFDNSWYKPGNPVKRMLWFFINAAFFNSSFPVSFVKLFFLKLFGAQLGKGLVIKPHVNIKYPWKLKVGNHVWLGENVWIDNLADVIIGDNVCVSQGAMLLCGNHNYKKKEFDLLTGVIILKDGSWIGAQSVVCPGITVGSHSVLSVASVASTNLEDYGIYRGNPAVKIKHRTVV